MRLLLIYGPRWVNWKPCYSLLVKPYCSINLKISLRQPRTTGLLPLERCSCLESLTQCSIAFHAFEMLKKRDTGGNVTFVGTSVQEDLTSQSQHAGAETYSRPPLFPLLNALASRNPTNSLLCVSYLLKDLALNSVGDALTIEPVMKREDCQTPLLSPSSLPLTSHQLRPD